jgi:hypothetical protein
MKHYRKLVNFYPSFALSSPPTPLFLQCLKCEFHHRDSHLYRNALLVRNLSWMFRGSVWATLLGSIRILKKQLVCSVPEYVLVSCWGLGLFFRRYWMHPCTRHRDHPRNDNPYLFTINTLNGLKYTESLNSQINQVTCRMYFGMCLSQLGVYAHIDFSSNLQLGGLEG